MRIDSEGVSIRAKVGVLKGGKAAAAARRLSRNQCALVLTMNNLVGKMFMHFFVIINSFLYSSIIVSSSNDAATTKATIAITKPPRVVTKLIHRDSIHPPYYKPGATTSERARWATESSMARFTYLKARMESTLSTTNDVRGGVIPIDDTGIGFLVKFSIGELPVPQLAVMDTGSSLSWVQCLPCTKCTFQFEEFQSRCTYRLVYLDNDTTEGNVAFEKLTFMTSDEGTTSVPSILFGCGHSNNFIAGKLSGVMGLGYHTTSLPSRLGSKFSYCTGNVNYP
ncbi:aspartic proteinase CDR1-like [Cornus florida]|uniref:aspartic proteinase CDR1-like n=1 Tax=Cornus florida TaxID=4283 RepID=UPI00289E621D|nr:aspartic proteinase CDR1-like [Cornus florida]